MIQYGVTKTAQLALASGLARMTAGTNVTVNSSSRADGVRGRRHVRRRPREGAGVSPAVVEKRLRDHAPTSLLKRFETTAEIANMVVYVSSAAASGTNGAALRVDGGVVHSIV